MHNILPDGKMPVTSILVRIETEKRLCKDIKALIFEILWGTVAQSVEQRTENPCVGGSIPPGPTLE